MKGNINNGKTGHSHAHYFEKSKKNLLGSELGVCPCAIAEFLKFLSHIKTIVRNGEWREQLTLYVFNIVLISYEF